MTSMFPRAAIELNTSSAPLWAALRLGAPVERVAVTLRGNALLVYRGVGERTSVTDPAAVRAFYAVLNRDDVREGVNDPALLLVAGENAVAVIDASELDMTRWFGAPTAPPPAAPQSTRPMGGMGTTPSRTVDPSDQPLTTDAEPPTDLEWTAKVGAFDPVLLYGKGGIPKQVKVVAIVPDPDLGVLVVRDGPNPGAPTLTGLAKKTLQDMLAAAKKSHRRAEAMLIDVETNQVLAVTALAAEAAARRQQLPTVGGRDLLAVVRPRLPALVLQATEHGRAYATDPRPIMAGLVACVSSALLVLSLLFAALLYTSAVAPLVVVMESMPFVTSAIGQTWAVSLLVLGLAWTPTIGELCGIVLGRVPFVAGALAVTVVVDVVLLAMYHRPGIIPDGAAVLWQQEHGMLVGNIRLVGSWVLLIGLSFVLATAWEVIAAISFLLFLATAPAIPRAGKFALMNGIEAWHAFGAAIDELMAHSDEVKVRYGRSSASRHGSVTRTVVIGGALGLLVAILGAGAYWWFVLA